MIFKIQKQDLQSQFGNFVEHGTKFDEQIEDSGTSSSISGIKKISSSVYALREIKTLICNSPDYPKLSVWIYIYIYIYIYII